MDSSLLTSYLDQPLVEVVKKPCSETREPDFTCSWPYKNLCMTSIAIEYAKALDLHYLSESIHLSAHLSLHLSIHLPIRQSMFYLSIDLQVHLPIHIQVQPNARTSKFALSRVYSLRIPTHTCKLGETCVEGI